MKKILGLFLLLLLVCSCKQETTIYGNPVISQVNILDGKDGYNYEVVFETAKKNYEECPKMQTNVRYQVGDTLLSLYESFDYKIKPVRDSLNYYKSKYFSLQKEFESQKNYIDFLQTKIPKN